MRIEKERMKKKLDKIGCATIIIIFVAALETPIALSCVLAGVFPIKMFQINMICICVLMIIFMLMMSLLADFDRKEKWKDESVEICGLCSEICVISNALIIKATYPKIDITIDANCCAGVTPDKHKAAMEVMKSCQINVIG